MGLFSTFIERFISKNTTEIITSESIKDHADCMLHRNFIALDIVTTGPCPEVDKLIEIAAVKMTGRVLVGRFSTVINPGISISSKISWLTGISNEQVIGAPGIGEVIPRLIEFIEDYPVIVDETSHGIKLVKNRLQSKGPELPNRIYDILTLSRKYLRDVTSHGYSYTIPELIEYIGHNNNDKKGAFEKAVTVAAIYSRIMETVSDEEIQNGSKMRAY